MLQHSAGALAAGAAKPFALAALSHLWSVISGIPSSLDNLEISTQFGALFLW